VGVYLGFVMAIDGKLRLVAQYTPTWHAFESGQGDDQPLDANLINFATGPGGSDLFILPANRDDSVAISYRHKLNAAGRVERTWDQLPVHDGLARATNDAGFPDALIRIQHDGVTIDESPVWDVRASTKYATTPTAGLPLPNNAVNLPPSFQEIGGSVPGGGYPPGYNDAWVERYASPSEPYGEASWASGSPQQSTVIVVEQLWFWGDAAHTVVLRIAENRNVEVLSDTVTEPTARPLVFLRLPEDAAWLVLGGPGTTITGYRERGKTEWTDVDTGTASTMNGEPVRTRRASFIHSSAPHIEVRLDVNGTTQIASM
jgi:hypothetical protein